MDTIHYRTPFVTEIVGQILVEALNKVTATVSKARPLLLETETDHNMVVYQMLCRQAVFNQWHICPGLNGHAV